MLQANNFVKLKGPPPPSWDMMSPLAHTVVWQEDPSLLELRPDPDYNGEVTFTPHIQPGQKTEDFIN